MRKLVNIITILFFLVLPKNLNAETLNCKNLNYNSISKLSFIDINLDKSEQRKFYKTKLKILVSKKKYIENDFKKFFNASIIFNFIDGTNCLVKGKIRITGDWKEHIDTSDVNLKSSIYIKLNNGNIFNIVKFKLFLPRERKSFNEVFVTNILRELGFIAPRTFLTEVSFLDEEKKFEMLFQEKDAKELLEYHNLREGPIIEGNEEYLFSDKFGELFDAENISLAKLVNSNISMKNPDLGGSIEALNVINRFYLNHIFEGNFKEKNFGNFVFPEEISSSKKQKLKNKKYEIIIKALGATHALRPHNRKFYYNNIISSAYPIYYDGMANILQKKNINLNKKDLFLINELIDELKNLKRNDSLQSRIFEASNMRIDKEKYNKMLDQIIDNLKNANLVFNSKVKNKFKNKHFKSFIKNLSLYNNKFVLAFHEQKNIFIYCDVKIKNCYKKDEKLLNIKKLFEGSYKKDDKYVIFVGHSSEYNLDKTYTKEKKFKFIEIDNSIKIKYKDVKLNFSDNKKIIDIYVKGNNPRVIFFESELKDKTINFINNFKNSKQLTNTNIDINGLTGCITVYDSKVSNLSLNSKNAICEDAINIINSVGHIRKVEINNSISDSLDLDFSRLAIENLNILNSKNDCLDVSSGEYKIDYIYARNCSDKSISIGEGSNTTINNANLDSSNTLIAVKDGSKLDLNNLVSENNEFETCIDVYRKKQEFSGSFVNYRKITKNCEKKIKKDKFSVIQNI